MLEKLKNTNVDDVNFTPFSYQARPSLPVRHDGPGKWVIVVLSALTGGDDCMRRGVAEPCHDIRTNKERARLSTHRADRYAVTCCYQESIAVRGGDRNMTKGTFAGREDTIQDKG